MIKEYFMKLYFSEGCEVTPILQNVRRRVMDAQNSTLIRPFEAQEVKEAIFAG